MCQISQVTIVKTFDSFFALRGQKKTGGAPPPVHSSLFSIGLNYRLLLLEFGLAAEAAEDAEVLFPELDEPLEEGVCCAFSEAKRRSEACPQAWASKDAALKATTDKIPNQAFNECFIESPYLSS